MSSSPSSRRLYCRHCMQSRALSACCFACDVIVSTWGWIMAVEGRWRMEKSEGSEIEIHSKWAELYNKWGEKLEIHKSTLLIQIRAVWRRTTAAMVRWIATSRLTQCCSPCDHWPHNVQVKFNYQISHHESDTMRSHLIFPRAASDQLTNRRKQQQQRKKSFSSTFLFLSLSVVAPHSTLSSLHFFCSIWHLIL